MDAETRRQIAELEELQQAHRGRLQILELQAARMGNSAPPETVSEIGDIKTKLVPIDAAIFKLTYVGAVRADVPSNNRTHPINVGVERALERERRAMVARQIDSDMLTEVRISAALSEMRHALIFVGGLAALALLIDVVLVTILITRGGIP